MYSEKNKGVFDMKKSIFILLAILTVLATAIGLVACDDSLNDGFDPKGFPNGGGETNAVAPTEKTITYSDDLSAIINEIDLSEYETYALSNATALEGNEITTAGEWVLSGDYSAITVSVGNGETTHIYLNGANITSDGIAISNINKKSTLIITVIGDNTVTSNSETENAIHVKGNLIVNGDGSLNVVANGKNGIKVSKAFEATCATINVNAKNHAIAARTVAVENATLNVTTTGKDGINAECDDETMTFTFEEGYVYMKNVNFTANVSGDGIQADTFVYIDGGKYTVKTNGTFVEKTSENMTTYDLENDDFRYMLVNGVYKKVASEDTARGVSYALTQSCKGIKVGEIKYDDADGNEIAVTDGNYALIIKGGTFDFDTTDDSFHCNSGDLIVEDGEFTVSTYDDGFTADNLLSVSGGKVTIKTCYEGFEGSYVQIYGGKIEITASDDAINAASDDETVVEHIIISGGEITVDADGDGIDSNGTILISGGTVIVNGPTSGGDCALDADGGILINGGTVIATSMSGMVETPSLNSTAYVVSYAQTDVISAGSVITVKDSSGNTVLQTTTTKNCQSIIFSTPKLEKGKTYTIYNGETELGSVTVSSNVTLAGTASQGGFGGGGQPGGNPPTGNPPEKR